MNTVMISGKVANANGSAFYLDVDDSYGQNDRHFFVKVLHTPAQGQKMPANGTSVIVEGSLIEAKMITGKEGPVPINHVNAYRVYPSVDGVKINVVCTAGNLVRDARSFQNQDGTERGLATVAIQLTKDEAFFPTLQYGNGTMAVHPYLTKGTKVAVSGALAAPGSNTGNNGQVYVNTYIRAFRIDLCGRPQGQATESQHDDADTGADDEDIPF